MNNWNDLLSWIEHLDRHRCGGFTHDQLGLEQNAGLVRMVSRKCYVIEVGRVVLEGDIHELMATDSVRRAFLG